MAQRSLTPGAAHLTQIGQQVGKRLSALAMLGEAEFGTRELEFSTDEGEPFPFQKLRWADLSIVLDQFRFVIEQI